MKTRWLVIVCIFLSSNFIFGTNFYVDKSASGNNNGTSWQDAWQSFSAISWSQIQNGDIIYISQGTYTETLTIPNGKSNLLITKGVDQGHNGEVIIDGQGTRSHGIKLDGQSAGLNGITISWMTIINCTWAGIYGSGENSGGLKNITVENCTLIDNQRSGIFFEGGGNVSNNYNIVIRNNYINAPDTYGSQTDLIYVQYLDDCTVDHNILIQDNTSLASSDLHDDNVQSFWVNNATYSYNIAVQQSNKTKGTQLLFVEEGNGVHKMYGNVLYSNSPNAEDAAMRIKRNSGTFHAIVYNNSIFTAQDQCVNTDDPNTVIKNNIFYSAGTHFHNINVQFSSRGGGSEVDYNLYYNPGMTSVSGGKGPNGIDGVNPQFVNLSDISSFDMHLLPSSAAINSGLDLGAPYDVDLTGTQRPQGGSWDIGAYEMLTGGGGGNNQPNQPSNPNPLNGATNQSVNLVLTWTCTDPDGDPLTYDIYFGTNSNPALVSSNQSSTSYNPGSLNTSTTYYWKIVAKDNQGATTTGPVWNFTTENSGNGGDTTPPELEGIQIIQSDELVLDFSEPMDPSQITNFQNYIISNQIQVTNASLNPLGERLFLTTTNHDSNLVYSIELTGLTDIAGNEISSQANSAFYKLLNFSQVTYQEYLIDNVSASSTSDTMTSPEKTLDGLVNGDPDPNSRWASQFMPQWIQYDLGAIKNVSLIATTFYRWEAGRIYQYSIDVSNDGNNWNEVIANQASSSQEWTLNEFSSLNTRYIRIICLSNNEADWAGLWETRILGPNSANQIDDTFDNPSEFSLQQNYPNPFNPSTNISFYIPRNLTVKLTVFNVLGNVVSELTNKEYKAGTHIINFDGTGLTSGIYFYRIETSDFIQTKKMTLLK